MAGKTQRTQGKKAAAACPRCGMSKDEWPDEGVAKNGVTYCCEGCAEDTGCECGEAEEEAEEVEEVDEEETEEEQEEDEEEDEEEET